MNSSLQYEKSCHKYSKNSSDLFEKQFLIMPLSTNNKWDDIYILFIISVLIGYGVVFPIQMYYIIIYS